MVRKLMILLVRLNNLFKDINHRFRVCKIMFHLFLKILERLLIEKKKMLSIKFDRLIGSFKVI